MTSALLPLLLVALQGSPAVAEGLQEALQARLAAFVAESGAPGVSAGLVTADGKAYALAAGLADVEQRTPLRPDDRLCAGSQGKTFVAAVALQLVQEGKLALDDLVGEHLGGEEWFERLPNAGELTLEHLLTHRTGLVRYEFDPDFARRLRAEPDHVWRPAELVAYALEKPPAFAAGAGFQYSDTNYILLGMVIEHVSGKTLYEEVERRLLAPLGLEGVDPQDGRSLPGLVQGYLEPNDPFTGSERTLLDGRFVINPQFEWAGGGFLANGGTLARWARALYEGDVLAPELRARMIDGKEARELGRGMKYGLGCQVWPGPHGTSVGHGGFFPGYLTEMRYWPEHRVAVAVQVNASRFALVPKLGALCGELLELTL
ncbi:MAG TPA: serine hydrolase domain-containing protein [Planctomycetota bacterium]